jgi:hypothetical protein
MTIKRGDIKRFREYLNSQDVGDSKHRHLNFQQRTRLYGDYLYHQDRERFNVELEEWLKSQNEPKAASHTPGPWRLRQVNRHNPQIEACDETKQIACTLDHQDDDYANAHLIAAAPDMLGALEAIEARIHGIWDNPALVAFGSLSTSTENDCTAIARAALAKARGEKS